MSEIDILNIIKNNNIKTISSLALSLDISESTARRKLKKLDSIGYVRLNRGGTFAIVDQLEVSVEDTYKQKQKSLVKQLAAKNAASKVKDGDIIFIDNGTSVRSILKYIKANNVKVYTSGIFHTLESHEINIEINIIPGQLLIKEASIVGEEALNYLNNLHLDKVFVGANGYDENGVYTPKRSEMIIKQFALKIASNGYIVVDSSKQNIKSKYKICEYDEYKIITELDI